MTGAQQSSLDRKLAMLHTARATIRPTANVQAAGNKPWTVYAPGGADQVSFPVLNANAVLLCQYKVNPKQSGALTGLVTVANGSNFVDNSGTAVWHLTLNGISVPGFENILSQLGSFANPLGTYVTLQENDLLQLWVAGSIYAVASATGYASGLLTGYLCYGGQGIYYEPRDAGDTRRGNGQNIDYRGSDNGRAPNSFGTGSGYNQQR
jgi:hypothetical protein